MGYRSDVGLCLSAEGMAELDKALATLDASNDYEADMKGYIHDLFKPDLAKKDASGAAAWLWPDLKWYSDYEDVQFVETFLKSLDEDYYYFLRIGEDIDDTEEQGWFWDNPFGMRLERSIQFD